uniref:DUF6598 domain-containing protein n=1 Tax=Hordeum vulgare subsp. vulgare TaxID=112509 RepID=A0A8I6W3Y5_HORVV
MLLSSTFFFFDINVVPYFACGTQGLNNLALSGPYRAISADGSFTIQVDGIIPGTDASKVSADMCWDCYSHDKAVYNKVLTNRITTEKGQLAEVTYAVLSDAVEATLQIKMTGVDPAVLYGEITAHNQHYGGSSVLLFSRTRWQAIKVDSAQEEEEEGRRRGEEDGWVPVPLARSVLAVPLGSPLEIRVDLSAWHEEQTDSFKEDMEFSLIHQHMGEIQRHSVVVQVTSLDICTLPEQSHIALPALATTWVPGMTSTRSESEIPNELHLSLDLNVTCGSARYGAFMDDFREKLADHPGKAVVHGRSVLARQQYGKPARLFMIKLAGDKEYERVTLAVRDDNLRLVGFKNQYESWYEFGMKPWLQESGVELGSDGSYESLLGRAEDRWQKLKLGRMPAIEAMRTLSTYRDRVRVIVDQDTKLALACVMVMICEAARFAEIYKKVKQGWEGEICITDRQVQHIHNWENISRFLFDRRWRVTNIGLENQSDAADVTYLVFDVTRPLLEVLGVRADSRFNGIISVVDVEGHKVIIYNNNPGGQRADTPSEEINFHRKEIKQDLPTTATYRPIPANGEIHIQVHGNPTTHTRLTLVWDGHSDKAHCQYNTVKTHRITIADSIAVLTYAVLCDAVEATVKVQLNLKEHETGTVAGVYGEITATNQHYGSESVLLFSHPKEQEVKPEVNASDAAISIPLKLMRDFIAASLERVLVIKVSLRAVCSSHEEPICFDQELRFNPYMGSEQTMKIDAPTMEAQVMFITGA